MNQVQHGSKHLSKCNKQWRRARQLLLAAAAIAPAAQAQFPADQPDAISPGKSEKVTFEPVVPGPNRFGLAARFGFNISAEFKNKGPFVGTPNPGPATGNGIDRFYDDGYVRPDETYPNNNGLTFFWGYENASQVGGNEISFHNTTPGSNSSGKRSPDDVPVGFEFTYARELGNNLHGSWGIESGFAFTDLQINDHHPINGSDRQLTDNYSLGTPPISVPAPPFSGTFNGVNLPVIGDAPISRTISTVPALITGRRELLADIYGLRVGPYFSYAFARHNTFVLGTGLATAIVDSTFRFNETSTTAAGSVNRSGRGDETDFLVGVYVSAQLTHQFNETVGVFGGVQFQSMGKFSQRVAGKEATLDLGQAVFVQGGVSFSF